MFLPCKDERYVRMTAFGHTLLVHSLGSFKVHVFINDSWVSAISVEDSKFQWPSEVRQMALRHGQLIVGDYYQVLVYRYSETPSPSISGFIWGLAAEGEGKFLVMSDKHFITIKDYNDSTLLFSTIFWSDDSLYEQQQQSVGKAMSTYEIKSEVKVRELLAAIDNSTLFVEGWNSTTKSYENMILELVY